MNALIQERGKLLRGVVCGEVGPSHIADEKRVSGENCSEAAPADPDRSSRCICSPSYAQEFGGTGSGTVRTESRLRP